MRRGLDAALIGVGRLIGPAMIGLGGGALCHDKMTLLWYGVGLIGAVWSATRSVPAPIVHVRDHPVITSELLDQDPAPPSGLVDDALVQAEAFEGRAQLEEDVASALMNLGYRKMVARTIAVKVVAENPTATTEELIRAALKVKK